MIKDIKGFVSILFAALILGSSGNAFSFKPSEETYGHTMITRSVLGSSGYSFGNYAGLDLKVPQFYTLLSDGTTKATFTADAINDVVIGAQSRDWTDLGVPGVNYFNCSAAQLKNNQGVIHSKFYAVCASAGLLITGDLYDEFAHFDNDLILDGISAIYKLVIGGPDWEVGLKQEDFFGDDPVTEAGKSVIQLLDEYVSSVYNSDDTQNLKAGDKSFVNKLRVARVKLGKALHSLHDFYAHSTWPEINGTAEIFYPISDALSGKNAFDIGLLSGYKIATSVYGLEGATNWDGAIANFDACDRVAGGNYKIDPVGGVISSGAFNSVSVVLGVGAGSDSWGSVRCDHGNDTFNIISGIAKDAPYMPITPLFSDKGKGYSSVADAASNSSSLHLKASYQAAVHTRVFMEKLVGEIRARNGKLKSDQMIAALLGTSIPETRTVFVVDTTASMADVLRGVREGLSVLPNNGKGFSLLTFGGDANSLSLIPDDIAKMQAALESPFGGGDCSEPSFAALKQAIESSPSGSSIYLLTDADPSDSEISGHVIGIALSRNIKVYPIVLGACGDGIDSSYSRLATYTRGILRAPPEPSAAAAKATMANVLSLIKTTPSIRSVVETRSVVQQLVSGAQSVLPETIRFETGALAGERRIEIPVDSGVSLLQVIGTVDSGFMSLLSPLGVAVTLQASGDGIYQEMVNAPAVGNWVLTVSGKSGGDYSVRADASGGVNLQQVNYEMVQEVSRRSGHEYRPAVSGNPTSGRIMAKTALAGVSSEAVTLEYSSGDGKLLGQYVLNRVSSGVYLGEASIPDSAYITRVFSVDAAGKSFSRVWQAEQIKPNPPQPGNVTMEVVGFQLLAGEPSRYSVVISNFGADDRVKLEVVSSMGTTSISPDGMISLPAGERVEFEVQVNVPVVAAAGAKVDLRFNAVLSSSTKTVDLSNTVASPIAGVSPDTGYKLSVEIIGGSGGIVTSSQNGLNCGTDCDEVYPAGSKVTLTAGLHEMLAFDGWGGACSGKATTCSVTMDEAKSVTASFAPKDLANALDNTTLTFTTGGDAPWTYQTAVTQDGQDAAQSGRIGNNQTSWLETTVTGPGLLGFRWAVSAETGGYDGCFDALRVYLDGQSINLPSGYYGICGEWPYTAETMPIPSGSHTVRWVYWKDGTLSAGSDAGYLDRVIYVQESAVDCLLAWGEHSASEFLSPAGQPTQTYAPYFYRHYPNVGNYFGVSAEDGNLYGLGDVSNGQLLNLGPWSDWARQAGCSP